MSMLLDLLFPKQCVVCRKWGKYVCEECKQQIEPLHQSICPGCYRASVDGKTHINCRNRTEVDGTASVFYYNTPIKKIIKSCKYKLYYDVLSELFSFIDKQPLAHFDKVLRGEKHYKLLAVPLHPSRKKARGFNQSDLIARYFSKRFNIPIVDGIVRIKNTKPQASLPSRESRRMNIENAFNVKGATFKEENIILVDDVFTSGSTLNELAKLIKMNSGLNVCAFTLAHGSFSK